MLATGGGLHRSFRGDNVKVANSALARAGACSRLYSGVRVSTSNQRYSAHGHRITCRPVIPGRPENVADLLRRFGRIPAFRVRLKPPPGTATKHDLIRHNESKLKTAICELVDGTLVEKVDGVVESAIAVVIIHALVSFARPRKLGKVLGADVMQRIVPGLVRVPGVSFLRTAGSRGPSTGRVRSYLL